MSEYGVLVFSRLALSGGDDDVKHERQGERFGAVFVHARRNNNNGRISFGNHAAAPEIGLSTFRVSWVRDA